MPSDITEEELQKRQITSWNFKRLMEMYELSIADLAKVGDCEEVYIRQILSCNVGFGTRAAKKWSKIFGVPISELYVAPESFEVQQLIDSIKHNPELIKSIKAFIEILLKIISIISIY